MAALSKVTMLAAYFGLLSLAFKLLLARAFRFSRTKMASALKWDTTSLPGSRCRMKRHYYYWRSFNIFADILKKPGQSPPMLFRRPGHRAGLFQHAKYAAVADAEL